MNIALLLQQRALAFLGTQLQHWTHRAQPVGLSLDRTCHKARVATELIADYADSLGASAQNHSHATTRPLRIVRVLDTGQNPGGGGRMVISGRMADVCAELDRLAAREAALT